MAPLRHRATHGCTRTPGLYTSSIMAVVTSAAAPPARPATAAARLGLIALFLGAFALASSPIFVRLSETGPSATGFYRLFIGGLALWSFAWLWPVERNRAPLMKLERRDVLWLIAAGVVFAADLITWHRSILLTTVANATFLGNLATVIVAIGGALFLKQRLGLLFAAGLVTTIAGAAILMGFSFEIGSERLAGDGLALAAAWFYGAYFLIVAHLRQRLATHLVMFWVSLIGALAILPAVLVSGERFVPLTAEGWLWLLGIGLVSQVAGQGLITYAFAHLSAGFTAVGTYVQPVATAGLAWILFGESLTTQQIAGCAIVMSGIWLAHRGTRSRAPAL